MNDIFNELVKTKIEQFVFDYKQLSKNIFVDKDGTLTHPGEFGTYRERIVAELIRPYLPIRLDIGTGFIICSNGVKSTQCDIVIYDKGNTPLIDNYGQRFFPVECVAGVIEVKSKLSKNDFKDALIKLSKIKQLRDYSSSKYYVFKDRSKTTNFDPHRYLRDGIATFIVCESIDYNFENGLNDLFGDTYNATDKIFYHNLILSIDNGCLAYFREEDKKVAYAPFFQITDRPFPNVLVAPSEIGYKHEHILFFINYFFMLISSISIVYFEITLYLGEMRFKKLLR